LHDRGDEVLVIDDLSTGARENLPIDAALFVADIGDQQRVRDILRTERPDAILHFAGKILPAESLTLPLIYFQNNTAKSISLIQAAIEFGTGHFIFSSTAAVYAARAGPVVNEDSETTPLTPYGRSKLMVEEVLRAAAAAHPMKAGVLRYFNVAGVDPKFRCGPAGPNPGHLIRTAIEVAVGQRPHLDVFGADYDTHDGTCVRDYIHVSDLALAHVAALDALTSARATPFTIVNCGYGKGVSVLEVIATVERVVGASLPFAITSRRPGDAPALVADSARLHALGWEPANNGLETIISTAYNWARGSALLHPASDPGSPYGRREG